MKITSKELDKIIMEEMYSFLKEEHPALSSDNNEDSSMLPDSSKESVSPMTPDELASSMSQTSKDIKSSPNKGEMKPKEVGEISSMLKSLLNITSQDGDASSLLKKVRDAIERIIKSSQG